MLAKRRKVKKKFTTILSSEEINKKILRILHKLEVWRLQKTKTYITENLNRMKNGISHEKIQKL